METISSGLMKTIAGKEGMAGESGLKLSKEKFFLGREGKPYMDYVHWVESQAITAAALHQQFISKPGF